MPAIYATNYAQKNSQNRLSFDTVEGTLFSGKAKSASFGSLRINDLNWELSPFYLFLLTANIDVTGGAVRETEQIYVDGNMKLSLLNPQKFTASNARIMMPVKPLLAQVELPVTVVASGRFRLDIASMTYNEGCQQLSGTGNWLQAAMNINSKPLTLGGFNAVLGCEASALAIQISPDNGIELDAKILLAPNGKYSAKGQFTIPNNFPNEVKQGAVYFGEAKGQGRYELNIESN